MCGDVIKSLPRISLCESQRDRDSYGDGNIRTGGYEQLHRSQLIDSTATLASRCLPQCLDLVQLSPRDPGNGASTPPVRRHRQSRATPGIDVSSYTITAPFRICLLHARREPWALLKQLAPSSGNGDSEMAWKSSASKPRTLQPPIRRRRGRHQPGQQIRPAQFLAMPSWFSAGCPCRQRILQQQDHYWRYAHQSPSFHRYQEGAPSRPILHEKLFFFADYEARKRSCMTIQALYFPLRGTAAIFQPTTTRSITAAPDDVTEIGWSFPPQRNTSYPGSPQSTAWLSIPFPKCNYPNPALAIPPRTNT